MPQVAAPLFGPVPVPVRQRFAPGHHPHWLRCVHVAQFVALAHGSPASARAPASVAVPASVDEQSVESHDQPDAQAPPAVGASRVPVWQRPVPRQKPHDDSAVQLPQVVFVAQGSPASTAMPASVATVPASVAFPVSVGGVPASTGAGHIAGENDHAPAHAPTAGPVAEPATQVFVPAHQPHGPRLVHVPHCVTAPQFTPVDGVSTGEPRSVAPASVTTCTLDSPDAQPTRPQRPNTKAGTSKRIPARSHRRRGRVKRTAPCDLEASEGLLRGQASAATGMTPRSRRNVSSASGGSGRLRW